MTGRWTRRVWPPLALCVLLLVAWQAAAVLLDVQEWLLPSPLQIVRAGWEAGPLLWPHIWQTARETVIGFGLALVVGLGLGMLIDYSSTVRAALYPLLVLSQTVPVIAIAPLLVIWFGYGILPKVIVVGLVCFFPIVVSTADGLHGADPEQIALLRTMGASRMDVFRKVRLPGAVPLVFTGVKVGITYSVVGAIMGEWVGASQGIGVFMLRATNSFRTDWVFVSIAVTAALSLFLFGLVTLLERTMLRWYTVSRRTEEWEELH
jgi:ABC-type nitrate/sulfonate/bicarbonate transport system permease component